MNKISVLIPSRGRIEHLLNAMESLNKTVSDPHKLEYLLKFDNDDLSSIQGLYKIFNRYNYSSTVSAIITPRNGGYINIHTYYNQLAALATGRWLFIFNDDCVMKNENWDLILDQIHHEFALVKPEDGEGSADPQKNRQACFPILTKKYFETIGHLSENPHVDTWIDEVFKMVGSNQFFPVIRAPQIVIEHNRIYDQLEQHRNEIYPKTSSDFFSEQNQVKRMNDAKEIKKFIWR